MRRQYINIQNRSPKISRISWGAILSGTLTAIVVAFLLNILGLGIGLTTIDPMTEANTLDGLGTGTLVWWGVSNIAALFIGGMVAGRMSGLPSNSDGGLHGFLAWSLYLIISLYLVTSSIGGILNGMANTVSSVFSDSTATNIAQALKDAETKGEDQATFSIEEIKQDAFDLINSAEKYNILPEDASEEVRSTISEARQESRELLREAKLEENIDDFFNDLSVDLDENGDLKITADGTDEILNKEEIKTYLAENTSLTNAEIEGTIEKWDRKINAAIADAEEFYAKAKTKAIKITDDAADVVGKFSIIAFFLFLLGAGAAFAGGAIGSPFQTVEEEQEEIAEERI